MPDRIGSNPGTRTTTLWLLGAAVILAAAALLVGISDNPPGIVLLYLAGLAMVLAGTHRWRSRKKFGLLFIGAVIGFFVLGVVHNFAEVGAHRIADLPVIPLILSGISVVGFLAALILCPVAGLVGAFGWVVTLRRGDREGT